MTNMILIYITCENKEQARDIGEHLLQKKLCACINIIHHIESYFLWPPKSGAIDKSDEAILLVKTIKRNYKVIEKEVKKIHSYDTPDIMAIPILAVDKKYEKWLKGEIK